MFYNQNYITLKTVTLQFPNTPIKSRHFAVVFRLWLEIFAHVNPIPEKLFSNVNNWGAVGSAEKLLVDDSRGVSRL